MAILFALISYLGWGVGDIFCGLASRKIGGYSLAFWSCLFASIALIPLIPFEFHKLQNITFGLVVLSVVIVVIAMVGDISFNEGLRKGNASLVGVIAAAYPALSAMLAITFLNEQINIRQVFSILIIVFGVVLSALNLESIRKNRIISDPGIPFALLTLISWGTYLTLIKITVDKIGWFWPGYFIFLGFPLIFLFMKLRKIKLQMPNAKQAFPFVLASIMLARMAELAYNAALGAGGNVAIISPISGSYPTLFVVLAFLVFKDPIKKQQIAGIITTLIGIVLLSVFSV